MKLRQRYKRGYPVAVLVGFENDHAVLWQVFSQVAKLHRTIKLDGRRTDERGLYNFHESMVDALKPMLNEGIRSIIVTSPMKTTYAADFLNHIRKHHAYLIQSKNLNKTTFAELVGSADEPHKVAELVKTRQFRNLIADATSGEADHIVSALEKQLNSINNSSAALYSLDEIEDRIYSRERHGNLGTEYLIMTDEYLSESPDKKRIHRLLQISENKKVKTRIIKAETSAGKRISQLGGIVSFATPIE